MSDEPCSCLLCTADQRTTDVHDQLAAALKEREEARAALATLYGQAFRLTKERDEARAKLARMHASAEAWHKVAREWETQNDTLHAALEPTAENVGAYAIAVEAVASARWDDIVEAFLAAIAVRAGIEEKP